MGRQAQTGRWTVEKVNRANSAFMRGLHTASDVLPVFAVGECEGERYRHKH